MTRLALVTGASRGFGYAAAVELARAGHHVVALARTVGGLEEVADEIEAAGGTSTLVPLDVTDEGGLARMCRAIHDRWGGLDLWLHAAIQSAPLAAADSIGPKDLDRALAVNVRATQRLIYMVTPLLRAAEAGRIVHLPDDKAGRKFFGAYGATKGAQTALFESFAAETARIGPRVTAFRPHPMPTALRGRFYPGENRDRLHPTREEARRLMEALAAEEAA